MPARHSRKGLPATTPRGELAVHRDPKGFDPFANLPQGDPARLAQWLEAVRVHAISSVEWQCSERWELGPRVLNDSMWFWFASGSGAGRVGPEGESEYFRIRPGDLMLIPQGAEHHVRQDKGSAMHLITAHFHAQVFEGINLLDLMGFPPHAPGGKDTPYEAASRRLAREYALKAPGWRAAMAAEIQLVLHYIARHHGDRFRMPGAGRVHAELPRLLPALEYIDRNLPNAALSVGELAKQLFVSEVQFRKLFRRVTGMSPVRFVQRRRVESACRMLRGSEMSLREIAEVCGFADVPFFSRVFKQWTRTTPAQYRDAAAV
ncbi:MAG: helix-turn-helix domain-containing protein [Planctomycetota bacterium]|nr:helix-turn-helix domain-containing protein [Planctomycetota bacterium]